MEHIRAERIKAEHIRAQSTNADVKPAALTLDAHGFLNADAMQALQIGRAHV